MSIRRSLLMAQQGGGLPAEYLAVEYIESTGSQYIITGIPVQSPIRIEADVMVTTASGDYALVCTGYRDTANVSKVRIGMGYFGSKLQNYYKNYYILNYPYFNPNTRYKNVYYGEEGLQRAWLNGVEADPKSYTTAAADLPIDGSKINFYIFAEGRNTNGTKSAYFLSHARMYGVKFANNTATLGNYIPCVRKSDNKPGMYDTVTKTFYTNAGSGEFIVPTT